MLPGVSEDATGVIELTKRVETREKAHEFTGRFTRLNDNKCVHSGVQEWWRARWSLGRGDGKKSVNHASPCITAEVKPKNVVKDFGKPKKGLRNLRPSMCERGPSKKEFDKSCDNASGRDDNCRGKMLHACVRVKAAEVQNQQANFKWDA